MKDLTISEDGLIHWPVIGLDIAPENPRTGETVDPAEIETLALNLLTQGQLTPMIGYQDGAVCLITAGGRRLRAFLHLLDRELIDKGATALVKLLPQAEAIEAGHAEQLTHVRMSPLDELRIYAAANYATASDADLAAKTGRSARYVRQRRKILELPEEILDGLWTGAICVDQAAGLTYAIDDPERLAALYERACGNARYDGNWLRDQATADFANWPDEPRARFVSQDAYREAGGRIQSDLFTDEELILDPELLDEMFIAAVREKVAATETGWGFFTRADEGQNLWDFRTHAGIDRLTDEERREWDNIRHNGWRLERDAEESGDRAPLERFQALKDKAQPFYPDELKALLGVVWKPSPRDADGYSCRRAVLPADLEPLYAGGWLDRPAPQPETAEAPEGDGLSDGLSVAMRQRIDRIATHALRMELAKSPDRVIAAYLPHALHKTGYTALYSDRREDAMHPEDALGCRMAPEYEALADLAAKGEKALAKASPEDQRAALAFTFLERMTTRHPRNGIGAGDIRRYWTPDAAFLKGYKKPQLLAMIRAAKPDMVGLETEKLAGLAEIAASVAREQQDWLPTGF